MVTSGRIIGQLFFNEDPTVDHYGTWLIHEKDAAIQLKHGCNIQLLKLGQTQ